MIEKIKQNLAQYTSLDAKVGVFVSAFDAQGALLASHGLVKTDRSLDKILDTFYLGVLKKHEKEIKSLVFDIVDKIQLQNDPNVLVKLSMKEYGLFLVESDGQNSGVLLPNTQGVANVQEGLSVIKKKYQLKSQVLVFIFTTKRVSIDF